MTSVPTSSPFAEPPPAPRPVVLLLSMTDLFTTVAEPLLAHTKLPRPSIKRDTTPSLLARAATPAPRSSRFTPIPRARSSPLSHFSDEGPFDMETTPEAMPSAIIASAIPNNALIPRPKHAQLSMDSLKVINVKDRQAIKNRINVVAPQFLKESVCYSKQGAEALEKFNQQILSDFPLLMAYEAQWPLKYFTIAHLKYTSNQSRAKHGKTAATGAASRK
ncbi:hypothetical protein B0H11DRAFT_2207557, partial [Mycena galericulata]